MKPPKQLPADLGDWIKARTFEIGAEMVLRPDSPEVWQGRGSVRRDFAQDRLGIILPDDLLRPRATTFAQKVSWHHTVYDRTALIGQIQQGKRDPWEAIFAIPAEGPPIGEDSPLKPMLCAIWKVLGKLPDLSRIAAFIRRCWDECD